MHRVQRYVATLSIATALSVSGCRKPAPDDATLTAAIQTRLSGDAALASESIQSTAQAGIVTLGGTVSSDAARVLAGNDAAQVAGVRTVVNNLTVASAAAPATAPFQPETAPNVSVAVPPSRIRSLPVKPSAAVTRSTLARNNPALQSPPLPPSSSQNTPNNPPIERPAPPQLPPTPTFRNVDIPSGTPFSIRITQTLDSATTQQGETFSGTVASDVLVDGLVVIPQGSGVSGRVDAVQEAAHFKGNSLLTLSLTSISRHGERIPISTDAYSKEGAGRGKNTAVKTGVGAAAGAILGGIFGGGSGAAIGAAAGGGTGAGINAVTRGQQVQIPSESLVSFRLSNSINVRVLLKGDRGEDRSNPIDPATPRRPLSN